MFKSLINVLKLILLTGNALLCTLPGCEIIILHCPGCCTRCIDAPAYPDVLFDGDTSSHLFA
jgi:hypothetical protein